MVWKNKISSYVNKERNLSMAEVEAFNFFKEHGEDFYYNHITKRKKLKVGVSYLVRINLILVVGDGSNKRLVWNSMISRKGRRVNILRQAKKMGRSKLFTEEVRSQSEAERKNDTLARSLLCQPLIIEPPGPEEVYSKCDLRESTMGLLVQDTGTSGVGYIKDGKLIGFQYSIEVSNERPIHDDVKNILITPKKIIYFV